MRIDEARTLNPGLLRHQIIWQKKAVTGQDSFGQDLFSWVDFLSCRAQVKALTGRELEQIRQMWAEARYKLLQHWSSGLEREMRLSWFIDGQTRYLDVLDIQDQPGTLRYQVVIARDHVQ